MEDIRTYQIEVQGQVAESDFSTITPLQSQVIQTDKVSTQLTFRTDQSGLIGLLRHLHARGFVLLSINHTS
jgi:hypothetical protein